MAYELVVPPEDEEDNDDYVPPLTRETDVWAFGMTILQVVDFRNRPAIEGTECVPLGLDGQCTISQSHHGSRCHLRNHTTQPT
jgi:hypothetical protein